MKILITGGAGFIGSAVVRRAIADGHQVLNLDALTYAACLGNLSAVERTPGYGFVQADIRNGPTLEPIFKSFAPDVVMHLAAESHVDRSIDGPSAFVDTNITGTFHLLQAARAYWDSAGRPDGFRFHHISTDEVYGSLPPDPSVKFTETTAYAPHSPYAASKAASDHLVRAWHDTYGLPTLITQCSNNYGPYQFPEKLIPVVILNALAGRAIPVYGDGANIRDWLYVDDHADALMTVVARGTPGQTYAISGENEVRNIDLVRQICAVLDIQRPRTLPGSYADQITFVTDRPGHDQRYAIDPAHIRASLGWRPTVTLQQGLAQTVRWYLDHAAWWQALQGRDAGAERLGLSA